MLALRDTSSHTQYRALEREAQAVFRAAIAHWLGVVIGSVARSVSEKEALSHVAGYCIVNDVSEREYQLERGSQWDKGKGCDTFGPVGPWLVTRDEVTNPQRLGLWLDLNGKRVQSGNTRTMIFSIAKIVSYVSRFMTLMPGDIIMTGTPPGVGMGMKPQQFLMNSCSGSTAWASSASL